MFRTLPKLGRHSHSCDEGQPHCPFSHLDQFSNCVRSYSTSSHKRLILIKTDPQKWLLIIINGMCGLCATTTLSFVSICLCVWVWRRLRKLENVYNYSIRTRFMELLEPKTINYFPVAFGIIYRLCPQGYSEGFAAANIIHTVQWCENSN